MSATSNTDATRQTARCTGGDAVSDQRTDNQGNGDQALSEHATGGPSDHATLAQRNDHDHPGPGLGEVKYTDSVWEADCEDGKLYCLCNGVSSGEMIACDGNNCEKEWFHLHCVGLTLVPPGEVLWFCPECQNQKRPRRIYRKKRKRSGGALRLRKNV